MSVTKTAMTTAIPVERREERALADVVEDDAALLNRGDDRGEVVVRNDEIAGLLGHVGAAHTHRDADISGPEGGCVVHAVTGDGDDLSSPAQRLDDAQFVGGRHARIDASARYDLVQILIGCRLDLTAFDRFADSIDADAGRDRRCGGSVIARQHEDADAGGLARGDRRRRLVPGRIHHADKPKQRKIAGLGCHIDERLFR